MLIYILLTVFSVIMAIVSVVAVIYFFIKKNKKIFLISLISTVVFTLCIITSSYMYFKHTLKYVSSEEFHDEARKQAENMGRVWGNTVSGVSEGLEASLDDEAIAKLANKAGKIVGKSVQSISEGVDETVIKTTVFADESIEKDGISIGRAEQVTDSAKYALGLYISFKKDFDNTLTLTAYDNSGASVDVSKLQIKQSGGQAKVYVFEFDHFKPKANGYCILSKSSGSSRKSDTSGTF